MLKKALSLSVYVFLVGCAHTTPSSSVSIESNGVTPSPYIGADIVPHIGASVPAYTKTYPEPIYNTPGTPVYAKSYSEPVYSKTSYQSQAVPVPSTQPVQTYSLAQVQPIATYTPPPQPVVVAQPASVNVVVRTEPVSQTTLGISPASPLLKTNTVTYTAPAVQTKASTVSYTQPATQTQLGFSPNSPLLKGNTTTYGEPVKTRVTVTPTAHVQPRVVQPMTFADKVKSVWGEAEYLEANNHNYVKYFSGYSTRGHIDFNKGKIRIETIDKVNPTAQLQTGIIQTLLIPSDPTKVDLFSDQNITPDGKPFLYGQVVDQDNKPIEWEWRASRFANYLLTNKQQSRASANGTVHYVEIDMVSNHLSQREYQYATIIRDAAQRYGIDEGLIYGIIKVESNFNPYAVSRDGAYGLMQIVPRSGGADVFKLVKARTDQPSKDYLLDPINNIDTGVAYLYVLKNHYLKNIVNPTTQHYMMASAYNGGIGGVLETFDLDRARAVQDINSLQPDQVFWALANKHPKYTARLYLDKVIQFEREFNQGKL